MDVETALLELKGLSKTIRIFHGLTVVDENQDNFASEQVPPSGKNLVHLWTRFFELHVLVANKKIRHEPLFRTWIFYVNEKLTDISNEISNLSLLQEVLETSKQVITKVVRYYTRLIENRLIFLNTNSVSFSQEYLDEAIDYYSFWHNKFEKIVCKIESTDMDVLLLADSLKLFNQNHGELQNCMVHWAIPLGCHYPKFDNALQNFLECLPPLPTPVFSSPNEVGNLYHKINTIVQDEFSKAIDYLTSYSKELELRSRTIFPTCDLLDRRFRHYREELAKVIASAQAPLRTLCENFEKAKEVPHGFLAYLRINDAINAVNSCGKILVITKRKVKHALTKYLLSYYLDVLRSLKKNSKTIRRLQKRRQNDLGYQLQLENRRRAYHVWKDALNTAISAVKNGKFPVISNVYQAQFYFVDFLK